MCSFIVILHLCLCCTFVVVFFVHAHNPFWSYDVRWCGTFLYRILQMFVPFPVRMFYIVMWAFFWCLVELNFFVFYESKTVLYFGYRTSQEIYYIHNSCKVSKLQKRVIRITSGAEPRASCRVLFRKLEILPVPCHCTVSDAFYYR